MPQRCRPVGRLVEHQRLGDLEDERPTASRPVARQDRRATSAANPGSTAWRGDTLTLIVSASSRAIRVAPRPQLPARRGGDEPAERHDQPGLLGERDELGRRDQPALGVAPADERLEPDDPCRRAARRSAGSGARTAPRSIAARSSASISRRLWARTPHRRVEDGVARLALRLGRVHRGIGVGEQVVRARPVGRGASAIPTLTPTTSGRPSSSIGRRRSLRPGARRARRPPPRRGRARRRTVNSSPPWRAAMSSARMRRPRAAGRPRPGGGRRRGGRASR